MEAQGVLDEAGVHFSPGYEGTFPLYLEDKALAFEVRQGLADNGAAH